MTDPLKDLEDELARQDEELRAFERTLRDLGDVELAVPHALLDELEELCEPRAPQPTPAMPAFAIRG